ncbi:MAG: hypothetical protein ACQEQO_07765 [Thermodesulfobacteriota bacterium]
MKTDGACRELRIETFENRRVFQGSPINDYYEYLIQEKGCPEHHARQNACRRLAILSSGVFKSGRKYKPYRSTYVKGGRENTSGL